MKTCGFRLLAPGTVAAIALAGAICLRSSQQAGEIGARWNQAAAIIAGAAVAIAADRFVDLDWYFAIPLGVLVFGAIRFPAYMRHSKNPSGEKNRQELPN
jgi:hypothetical protein